MDKNDRWSSIIWKKLKDMGWKRVFDVIKPSAASFISTIMFIVLVAFFPSQQWEAVDNDLKNQKKDENTTTSSVMPTESEKESISETHIDIRNSDESNTQQEPYPPEVPLSSQSTFLDESSGSQGSVIIYTPKVISPSTTLESSDKSGVENTTDSLNTSESLSEKESGTFESFSSGDNTNKIEKTPLTSQPSNK